MRFRVEGFRELDQNLASLKPRVSRNITRAALRDAAEPMRAHMERAAPVATRRLSGGMVITGVRMPDASMGQAVAVGPARKGFYGIFQEFGTSRHGAKPFARPAFDLQRFNSLDRLKNSIWAALVRRGFNVRRGGGGGRVVAGPGGGGLL